MRETLARLGARRRSRAPSRSSPPATPTSARSRTTSRSWRSPASRSRSRCSRPRASRSRIPKAWQYAQALVEGRADEALAIAYELFATDPRGAAVPLASALAREMGLLWELARPGGGDAVEPRHRWRARKLQNVWPAASAAARARRGYEAAVRGFEAVVTGRIDDGRAMIELLTADIAANVTAVRTPA